MIINKSNITRKDFFVMQEKPKTLNLSFVDVRMKSYDNKLYIN